MTKTLGGRVVIRLKEGESVHRGVKLVMCRAGKGWCELVPSEAHEREQDVYDDYQKTYRRQVRAGRRSNVDSAVAE